MRGAAVMRAAAGFVLLVAAWTWAGAAATPARPSEEELYRQIKVDVFDEDWKAVLAGCEDLLARFPDSSAAPQAAFYRGRALTRLPGREADATAALREFLARYPGQKLLVEQAWAGIFSLACNGSRRQSAGCVSTLSEGLANPSAYVSTLAAIRASDTTDDGLRRRALAGLKKALDTQSEPDIRGEILIAILKIDPREVPPPETPSALAGGRSKAGAATGAGPSLIKVTIYNKTAGRYDLKINLPVAFAQMLINSLDEEDKAQIRMEAGRRGIDLDDIFEAIQKAGAGRFLDVDTPETRIEVWIE
jgi:hypothetical protein